MQRAVAFGLLLRLDHLVKNFGLGLRYAAPRTRRPRTIRCFFSLQDGVAERPGLETRFSGDRRSDHPRWNAARRGR